MSVSLCLCTNQNPVDATMSLAKGARMQGAQFFSGIEVDRVLFSVGTDGLQAVSGVETTCGT